MTVSADGIKEMLGIIDVANDATFDVEPVYVTTLEPYVKPLTVDELIHDDPIVRAKQ